MGTPSVDKWPGLADLPNWKEDQFEKYPGESLKNICPSLDPQGLDLLSKLLRSNPQERISAKQALEHEYFKEIAENWKKLYQK